MCVCVCVPHTPHGGLSDTSALEISSGGGSGLNSLPVRIRTWSPDFEKACNRASLGCGGMGDWHHGCAADKSVANHVNMDQNL